VWREAQERINFQRVLRQQRNEERLHGRFLTDSHRGLENLPDLVNGQAESSSSVVQSACQHVPSRLRIKIKTSFDLVRSRKSISSTSRLRNDAAPRNAKQLINIILFKKFDSSAPLDKHASLVSGVWAARRSRSPQAALLVSLLQDFKERSNLSRHAVDYGSVNTCSWSVPPRPQCKHEKKQRLGATAKDMQSFSAPDFCHCLALALHWLA